jgi:hypothetical protein
MYELSVAEVERRAEKIMVMGSTGITTPRSWG